MLLESEYVAYVHVRVMKHRPIAMASIIQTHTVSFRLIGYTASPQG